jgi:hypothetical protein
MRSIWDEIHPGRPFAEQLSSNPITVDTLQPQVAQHVRNLATRLGCPYDSAD